MNTQPEPPGSANSNAARRSGDIAGVVLAAGRSRRMGTQKLLLPFGGRPLITHIIEQLLATQVHPIVVVVGADATRIARALPERPVQFVINPDPASDMLASIRFGLASLPARAEGVLLVLGDQPGLSAALVESLIQAFRAGPRDIVVPTHRGARGHPLLFHTRYRTEVQQHFDAVGLRGLLQAHPDAVAEVETNDASALADLDEPADYERLRDPGAHFR